MPRYTRAMLMGLVFPYIPDPQSDEWASGAWLAEQSGVSVRSVRRAISDLRTGFPEYSLISSVKGYRFSADSAEIRASRRWLLEQSQTIQRHVYTGIDQPALRKHPKRRAELQRRWADAFSTAAAVIQVPLF